MWSGNAVFVCLAIAVVRLWIMPLNNSFWLDETLTVTLVQDGIRKLFDTALILLPPVPYCILEWAISQVAGINEIAMRLPSVLGGIGMLVAVYRLGSELAGLHTGVICAVLCIAHPAITREVPNARPYALGLCFCSAALLWQVRWIRQPDWTRAWLWAGCSVAACALHYVFVIAFFMQIAVAIAVILHSRRYPLLKPLAIVCGVSALVLLPTVPQLMVLVEHRRLMSYTGRPHPAALFAGLAPASFLIGGALWVATVAATRSRIRWVFSSGTRAALGLGIVTGAVPVIVFFTMSLFTEARLFTPRYLLSAAPGLILLWGAILGAMEPRQVSGLAAALVLGVAAIVLGGSELWPDYRHENWRSVARAVPRDGAVLLYSGLVECRRLDWLQDPVRWKNLASPVVAYAPEERRDRLFLLPFEVGQAETSYLNAVIDAAVREHTTVTVVARKQFAGPRYVQMISERLQTAGFEERPQTNYDGVDLLVFRKTTAFSNGSG